ncbi:MAG: hypothetical protein WDM88_11860 [Galbitalea sp.]
MSIKKKTIIIAAGIAVFAAVSASAATLGGVKTDDLGANSNAVAGQLTGGVNVSFTTTYDATLGGYKITGVTLTANGAETFPTTGAVSLTLKGTGGVALATITGTGGTLTYSGSTVAAHDVTGVSLVVNGGATTAAVTATS